MLLHCMAAEAQAAETQQQLRHSTGPQTQPPATTITLLQTHSKAVPQLSTHAAPDKAAYSKLRGTQAAPDRMLLQRCNVHNSHKAGKHTGDAMCQTHSSLEALAELGQGAEGTLTSCQGLHSVACSTAHTRAASGQHCGNREKCRSAQNWAPNSSTAHALQLCACKALLSHWHCRHRTAAPTTAGEDIATTPAASLHSHAAVVC